MAKIELTFKEKQDLESEHKLCHDKHKSDRIKAILLCNEGWSTGKISQALRIHETSVLRHLKEYQINEKLEPINGGSDGYLSEEQTQKLITHLEDKTYQYSYQIVIYIMNTWEIKFSISGLNKWLHQHGFSYKRPKGVPHKFNKEAQAKFIEEYKNLKNSVETDPILFMDAMHPTQATKVTCGWIKTGDDKTIETTGSRTRLNIIGAIELKNLNSALVENYETINGDSIIEFLRKVKAQYSTSQNINLILDCAPYHKSKKVTDFAEELNITLHYLPPYSPNLNPIERFWKIMNEHVSNNKYFASAKEFREKIDDFFKEKWPIVGDSFSNRINDNFQVLNQAS